MGILYKLKRFFVGKEKVRYPYSYVVIGKKRYVMPTVAFRVSGLDRARNVRFLVDTGAAATSLPIRYAEMLGSKIDRRKKVKVAGIGKDDVSAYWSKIDIQIGIRFYSIGCYFVENEFIPLLGRVDVWKYFSILFDNKKKQVVFEKV